MGLRLLLEAVQLLAGRPDVHPEESRGLAPLVDGTPRRGVLRALGGRSGALEDARLLDGDATPAAPPAHRERGVPEKQAPYALKKT